MVPLVILILIIGTEALIVTINLDVVGHLVTRTRTGDGNLWGLVDEEVRQVVVTIINPIRHC